MATIAVIGTLDSKGEEHAFVAERIRARGHRVLLIDVGTGGPPSVQPDFTRDQVAESAGLDLTTTLSRKDRGECIAAMSRAAPVFLSKLAAGREIHGVISLGGGGGTAIATSAMRTLPIGFPKLMVSVLAAGNTAPYLGTSDIVMMPSITDIAGLNRLSRLILARAAGAICGMVEEKPETEHSRPLVVASMFGNTTACVTEAKRIIENAGYEVLVFAATGSGGRSMEGLIRSGLTAGVLDLTTTELADELVGGILSAGPDRMNAAADAGVPAVVAPGCLDMVNFGEPGTVPADFSNRVFYQHNPQITLMRTTSSECAELGRILAEKVNLYQAPTVIMLPRRALSAIGAQGQPFHDSAADEALFQSIRIQSKVAVEEFDEEINSPAFARACAEKLLQLIDAMPPKT